MRKEKIKRYEGTVGESVEFWVNVIESNSPAFAILQKLDVLTNEVLKRALRFTGRLGVLASEEEESPVSISHE